MASSDSQIIKEFQFFRVYKDGRVEFYRPPCELLLPSNDPTTGVRSKDVISSEPPVSARIFMPKLTNPNQKFRLIFYLHGSGFCIQSPFSPRYHSYCTALSAQTHAMVVSVKYGLFPARPIPACYEDSWTALRWVATHVGGNGPEPWLNDHADFERFFIAGDSSGGNISHNLAVRAGSIGLSGAKVYGLILAHPFFGGSKDDEMWLYMCPDNRGLMDPRLRPPLEDLAKISCERMLVFLTEDDSLREPALRYCEDLKRSGWRGSLQIVEHKGVEHIFHVMRPTCPQASDLMRALASFINQDNVKCMPKL